MLVYKYFELKADIDQVICNIANKPFVERVVLLFSLQEYAISELPGEFASLSKRVLVHNLSYGNTFCLHIYCLANQLGNGQLDKIKNTIKGSQSFVACETGVFWASER